MKTEELPATWVMRVQNIASHLVEQGYKMYVRPPV